MAASTSSEEQVKTRFTELTGKAVVNEIAQKPGKCGTVVSIVIHILALN